MIATMSPEAAAYLAAVDQELADLPAEERAELLEDLGLHLADLAEEEDARALEVRLGSPASYAAELRTAAGLPPRGTTGGSPRERLGTAISAVRAHKAGQAIGEFLLQVRPAWWVLRGYLVVLVPCMLYRNRHAFYERGGKPFYLRTAALDFPVPAPWGSHLLGVVLVLAAIVASVAIGRRRLSRIGVATLWLGTVVLLLATTNLVTAALDRVSVAPTRSVYISVSRPDPLSSSHGAVTNIYPYAADGTPLQGVLLYDQDGRPLNPSQQEWWPDGCARALAQPKAADGVPVRHSYPQQYVLDQRGVTTGGLSIAPNQCVATVAVPRVQLPTFAKGPR